MTTLRLWQIDAFADAPLGGNPAAVVPLEAWLDTARMQAIARENNLSETAFFVSEGEGQYGLRWFTPGGEVELCGHATLASAWLVLAELAPRLSTVRFHTKSGELAVTRDADGLLSMSLPADPPEAFAAPEGYREAIGEALGIAPPQELYRGRYLLALWDDAAPLAAIKDPGDIARVLRRCDVWGLAVTAPGTVSAPGLGGTDFVSRFFAPDKGVPEDPVTGSAHCLLTPFWAKRLGKKTLKARQISPRGGDLLCTDDGARTILAGRCALYLKGEIYL